MKLFAYSNLIHKLDSRKAIPPFLHMPARIAERHFHSQFYKLSTQVLTIDHAFKRMHNAAFFFGVQDFLIGGVAGSSEASDFCVQGSWSSRCGLLFKLCVPLRFSLIIQHQHTHLTILKVPKTNTCCIAYCLIMVKLFNFF